MATILIVDDSPTARVAVCEALEGCGHSIIECSDGEEAFAAASRSRPDLAIVDVVMERTNGFRLCHDLRHAEATRGMRLVMLTAKSGEADSRWGFSQGADAFLIKPFDPAVLRATIEQLLAEVES